MRIRKGDEVIVIGGKDRGKEGTVKAVDPKRNRVYVEGLNVVKKAQRPQTLRDTQRQQNLEGGIIEREGPIDASNVALKDPKDGRPTRIGIVYEDGERKRVARRSGTVIE
jgi:large subunit ribosomal protein L24